MLPGNPQPFFSNNQFFFLFKAESPSIAQELNSALFLRKLPSSNFHFCFCLSITYRFSDLKVAKLYFLVVVQLLSRVQLFATPCPAAFQASLSFTISWSLLKFISIKSVIPFNHLVHCHPLLLPFNLLASGSFPVSQIFASGGQNCT